MCSLSAHAFAVCCERVVLHTLRIHPTRCWEVCHKISILFFVDVSSDSVDVGNPAPLQHKLK